MGVGARLYARAMSDYEVAELFTVPRSRRVLAPGAVHLPNWLDHGQQQELVTVCREWVRAAPMKHQVMPGGGRMSVQSVMLGTREPYRYGAAAGPHLPELPEWLMALGTRAVAEAYAPGTDDDAAGPGRGARSGGPADPGTAAERGATARPETPAAQDAAAQQGGLRVPNGAAVPCPAARPGGLRGPNGTAPVDRVAESTPDPVAFDGIERVVREHRPDSALVNFYDDAAHMGMHQDKDEFSAAPIVSLSLGDTCVFRFGNTETRTAPYQDVELRSGDLFVFGGPSRYAFHGVPRVLPGTGGRQLGLKNGGRLNITLRMTGGRGGR